MYMYITMALQAMVVACSVDKWHNKGYNKINALDQAH